MAKLQVDPDGGLTAVVTDARVERGFNGPLWHSEEPVFGHANVWRPDERSVQIEFHPRLVNIEKWPYNAYRWAVATVYVDETEGTPCGDPNVAVDPERCRDKTFFILHDLRK